MATSLLTAFLFVFTGCKSIQIDPSTSALASGDQTLFVSASSQGALPGQGGDIYRVSEGSAIADSILLVLPNRGDVTTGEVTIQDKAGLVHSYSWQGNALEIPWKDLFDHNIFSRSDSQLLKVTGTLTWADAHGNGGVTPVEGVIQLIVLKQGYTPMPIDSGENAWQSVCTYQFSTAGRTAVSCK